MTTENNNQFRIYSTIQPIVKNLDESTVKDSLILKGTATTNSNDLEKDTFTDECIEDMKNQVTNLNIHSDHVKELNGIIGTVLSVEDSENSDLQIRFKILPSYTPPILEMVENGVKLGLSVKGLVQDYTPNKEGGWDVNKIKLMEISLTGLPANWDTFGTVQLSKDFAEAKCLSGACELIRKNIAPENEIVTDSETETKTKNKTEKIIEEEKSMDENNPNVEETGVFTPEQEQAIIDLINEGFKGFRDEILNECKTEEKTVETETETEKEETTTNDDVEALKNRIAELEGQLEEAKACGDKKKKEKSFNQEEFEDEIKEKTISKILEELGVERDPDSETEKMLKAETEKEVEEQEEVEETETIKSMKLDDIAEMLLA